MLPTTNYYAIVNRSNQHMPTFPKNTNDVITKCRYQHNKQETYSAQSRIPRYGLIIYIALSTIWRKQFNDVIDVASSTSCRKELNDVIK